MAAGLLGRAVPALRSYPPPHSSDLLQEREKASTAVRGLCRPGPPHLTCPLPHAHLSPAERPVTEDLQISLSNLTSHLSFSPGPQTACRPWLLGRPSKLDAPTASFLSRAPNAPRNGKTTHSF